MKKISPWVIETKNITKIFNNGEVIRALDGVNLQIAPSELVTIMGPSGSGKSTLLNVVGALDKPTSGKIFINGQSLSQIKNIDHFRAKTIGFIFQLHNLIPTLTARENVEIPMIGHNSFRNRKKRAEELLGLVGLSDRMNHLPNQLSGGQRQRVAVARALSNKPSIILADEPTGSLDTSAGLDLMKLLKDLNEFQGTTFVVVTHDENIARQTRRVIIMSDGKIVSQDMIGTTLEEDLKSWKRSKLGQILVEEDDSIFEHLSLTKPQIQALKTVLTM